MVMDTQRITARDAYEAELDKFKTLSKHVEAQLRARAEGREPCGTDLRRLIKINRALLFINTSLACESILGDISKLPANAPEDAS